MLAFVFARCDKHNDAVAPQQNANDTTKATLDIPKFITTDYIEADKIERISKFRSAIGHDYWDDFERCRSMKHYFSPRSTVSWSSVKIFSPITGKIVRTTEEWAGTQIQIQSAAQPKYIVIIFHIALQHQLNAGDSVFAGQQLGTHFSSQTMSDIAVGFSDNNRWKLISYFEVISDSVFQHYSARGITSRTDCIISKETRDADTLKCNGENFISSGTLENWVVLK